MNNINIQDLQNKAFAIAVSFGKNNINQEFTKHEYSESLQFPEKQNCIVFNFFDNSNDIICQVQYDIYIESFFCLLDFENEEFVNVIK